MTAGRRGDTAVVIGASIAGLTAAKALSDHFASVVLLERDDLQHETPSVRPGVPQGRHPHVLLASGQVALEQLFPGIRRDLIAQGAHFANVGTGIELYINDTWRPNYQSKYETCLCSRALMEHVVRKRVLELPNVQIIDSVQAEGLRLGDGGRAVDGVFFKRDRTGQDVEAVAADLVVDASGRRSRARQWLVDAGFPEPEQVVVSARPGYATRVYQRPSAFKDTWKNLLIVPEPKRSKRGAVIAEVEHQRWEVTLIGMDGDYPPVEEAGFLEFARGLASDRVYKALEGAEPLTKIHGFRGGENVRTHYERLPRHLERFLVIGDAVCALNPVYGQGMSVSAMGAIALDECLRAGRSSGTLLGLAALFQKRVHDVAEPAWMLSSGSDRQWLGDPGADPQLTRFMEHVAWAATRDPLVADAVAGVQTLMEPIESLFRNEVVLRMFHLIPVQR